MLGMKLEIGSLIAYPDGLDGYEAGDNNNVPLKVPVYNLKGVLRLGAYLVDGLIAYPGRGGRWGGGGRSSDQLLTMEMK